MKFFKVVYVDIPLFFLTLCEKLGAPLIRKTTASFWLFDLKRVGHHYRFMGGICLLMAIVTVIYVLPPMIVGGLLRVQFLGGTLEDFWHQLLDGLVVIGVIELFFIPFLSWAVLSIITPPKT